jgi:molecular chaperone GrpE
VGRGPERRGPPWYLLPSAVRRDAVGPRVSGKNKKKRTMTDSVSNDEELVSEDAPGEEGDIEIAAEAEREDEGEGSDLPAPDELGALRRKFDELEDKHLRLVAEFNNYRRRSEQERLGAWSRAQADVIAKFLDLLDDLQRVAKLDLSNATVEAIMEGVDLVERKFVRMLEDAGVEMIDPAGQPFDPERMEGVMRMPAESAEQDDTVAMVMQKGYALKGALVRPARVAVFKHG